MCAPQDKAKPHAALRMLRLLGTCLALAGDQTTGKIPPCTGLPVSDT